MDPMANDLGFDVDLRISQQGSCSCTIQDQGGYLRELFFGEQATAPRVRRTGTRVNWRLQLTRQLVASGDKKKKKQGKVRNDASGFERPWLSLLCMLCCVCECWRHTSPGR